MLEDSASEVLGPEFGSNSRTILSPVAMEDGMTTADRYRQMKNTMAEDVQIGSALAKSSRDQLSVMQDQRKIQAMEQETQALAELDKLDPFGPDFEKNSMQFNQMATLSPVIDRALDQKFKTRAGVSSAMAELGTVGAAAGMNEKEFEYEKRSAMDLLKRGDMEGYADLINRHSRAVKSNQEYEAQQKLESSRKSPEQVEFENKVRYDKELDVARRKHVDNMADIDVVGLEPLDPEFFQGELAGERARLPSVVSKYVAGPVMESLFDTTTGELIQNFAGFDKLSNVLKDTGVTSPEEVQDLFTGMGAFGKLENGDENPDAQRAKEFLSTLALDVRTQSRESFIAEYGDSKRKAAARGEQGMEATKLLNEFLGGLHDEVSTMKKFSAEKERFRETYPEFGVKAREAKGKRVAKEKATAEEHKRHLEATVEGLIKSIKSK